MADRPPCLSCGERPARSRRVCSACNKRITEGRAPDVRSPAEHGPITARVRHADAVRARIAYTLARYPHLKRS